MLFSYVMCFFTDYCMELWNSYSHIQYTGNPFPTTRVIGLLGNAVVFRIKAALCYMNNYDSNTMLMICVIHRLFNENISIAWFIKHMCVVL